MNIVDSCGWLEYFSDGKNADFFADAIEDSEHLLVPVLCVTEVCKSIMRQRSEGDALQAAAAMQQGRIIDLDVTTALLAAKLGIEYSLPLADSIIYATARIHKSIVWTQDSDFASLENVRYTEKYK